MILIDRYLKSAIINAAQFFPVLTITGPRQSGKTTLCKNLFSDIPYINLETAHIREQIMQDTVGFLDSYPQGLLIDEAHHYPQLFSYIQVAVDENPNRKYVLTGSSNFALLEKITQSLAGLTALFTLLPFSLREITSLTDGASTDTLILNGGYPAVWAKNTPINLFCANYYATYIERHVRQILNINNHY